jgi:hypothetical protein
LSFIGHTTGSLWSVDLFRYESFVLRSYWVLVVMDHILRKDRAGAQRVAYRRGDLDEWLEGNLHRIEFGEAGAVLGGIGLWFPSDDYPAVTRSDTGSNSFGKVYARSVRDRGVGASNPNCPDQRFCHLQRSNSI